MEQATEAGYTNEARATAIMAGWTLAWVATLAVAQFGPEWWGSAPAPGWIAIGVNLAAGVAWIVAHGRYLRATDELQRKIQLDALAITLGAGFVGGLAYIVAQDAGLLPFELHPAVLFGGMGVVYLLAIAAGRIRYR